MKNARCSHIFIKFWIKRESIEYIIKQCYNVIKISISLFQDHWCKNIDRVINSKCSGIMKNDKLFTAEWLFTILIFSFTKLFKYYCLITNRIGVLQSKNHSKDYQEVGPKNCEVSRSQNIRGDVSKKWHSASSGLVVSSITKK